MVDQVVTKQELIDAQKDAQSLDDFINGGDEQIVVTRLLKEYPTLANAIRQIYEKGGKFYPTLAAANADIANIRTDVYVITGDNGAYYKAAAGATSLTKSAYDPLVQSKTYIDTSLSKNITRNQSIDVSSGNVTLTEAQANLNVIYFVGTLTANASVVFPKKRAQYIVFNATTGGFAVALKTLDQSSAAIELKPNEQATIYNSDSDVRKLYADRAYKNGDTLTNTTLESSTASIKNADDSSAAIASTAHVKSAIDWKNSSNVITLTDADRTLTASELSKNFITFTGALTVSPTITLTTVNKMILIRNDSNLSVKVKGSAGISETLSIRQYDSMLVVSNGGLIFTPAASVRFDEYLRGAPTTTNPLIEDNNTRIATTAHVKSLLQDRASIKVINLTQSTTPLITSDIARDIISFTTALADNPIVILPNTACVRFVRNASTKDVILKGSDALTTINISPNKLATILISGTAIFKLGEESAIAVKSYKGKFKYSNDYFTGDTVEHGSGIYNVISDAADVLTPLNHASFNKIAHNDYAGANRSIAKKSETVTSVSEHLAPRFITKNGRVTLNSSDRNVRASYDYGKTWAGTIIDFGERTATDWVRQTEDGELLVCMYEVRDAPLFNVRKLKKSVGWKGDHNPPTSWIDIALPYYVGGTRYTSTESRFYGINYHQWGFSEHANILIVTEYGIKTGVAYGDKPTGAAPNEYARFSYISKDYGKTWDILFDLNNFTDGVGVHMHGAVYDPYWNRIWVSHGDGSFGSNGLFYSDDLGKTWKSATEFHNQGVNFAQTVHIVPMPTCVLFGSDTYPNGIHRLDRAQGKSPAKGWYDIETAYLIPEQQTRLNHLCQSVAKTQWLPNSPVIFGFSSETVSGKDCVVATFDGWSFYPIWISATASTVGKSVRTVTGITYENEVKIICDYTTTIPDWKIVTVKVDID